MQDSVKSIEIQWGGLEFQKEIKDKMGRGIFEGKVTENFLEMFVERVQPSEPGSLKSPKKNK